MISASQIKLIRSLRQKKYRDLHHLYFVEGEKMVRDMLACAGSSGHKPEKLFATQDFLEKNPHVSNLHDLDVTACTHKEMERISQLVTPQPVLALVSKPDPGPDQVITAEHPVLAFESIRDPGNLGAIMRTADWFGIKQVVCSPDSADLYNPKVVQSTMGAIFRVHVIYRELAEWLAEPGMEKRQIIGTFLDGENLYSVSLKQNPVILFGNESKGLSARYDTYFTRRISIPPFGQADHGPESLNVAASVAVVCSELRREILSRFTQSGS
jgi:TrmH family RNA methyltransferase